MKKSPFALYIQNIKKCFAGLFNNLADYLKSYGGFYALMTSPYLVVSIIINLFMYKSWTTDIWMTDVKTIIPSILGFSLGAYAILSIFGSEQFQKFISDECDGKNTLYMQVNTSFVHFILAQVLSLLIAILFFSLLDQPYSLLEIIFSFFGNFLFVYSICLMAASVLNIFRISKLYQAYLNNVDKDQN